ILNGDDGDDNLTASAGATAVIRVTLNGGAGNDVLSADGTINGGDGNDQLIGGAGNNTLDGGTGDDIFVGNGGTDAIGAGIGVSVNDSILVDGTNGADII